MRKTICAGLAVVLFAPVMAAAQASVEAVAAACDKMADRNPGSCVVGDDRYSTIGRLRAIEAWGVPKVRALVETTYFAGLRRPGCRRNEHWILRKFKEAPNLTASRNREFLWSFGSARCNRSISGGFGQLSRGRR